MTSKDLKYSTQVAFIPFRILKASFPIHCKCMEKTPPLFSEVLLKFVFLGELLSQRTFTSLRNIEIQILPSCGLLLQTVIKKNSPFQNGSRLKITFYNIQAITAYVTISYI